MARWGEALGRRLKLGWRWLSGSGEGGRRRAMRLGAWLCLTAAVVLFGLAGVVQLNQPPVKRPLPVGTRFSMPLASATPAPVVASVPLGPRLDETARPELATTESPTPEPTASPTSEPSPTPAPTPPPSEASVIRLAIPSIKVDAPISYKS